MELPQNLGNSPDGDGHLSLPVITPITPLRVIEVDATGVVIRDRGMMMLGGIPERWHQWRLPDLENEGAPAVFRTTDVFWTPTKGALPIVSIALDTKETAKLQATMNTAASANRDGLTWLQAAKLYADTLYPWLWPWVEMGGYLDSLPDEEDCNPQAWVERLAAFYHNDNGPENDTPS